MPWLSEMGTEVHAKDGLRGLSCIKKADLFLGGFLELVMQMLYINLSAWIGEIVERVFRWRRLEKSNLWKKKEAWRAMVIANWLMHKDATFLC